jgi:hypothetical protein
MKTLMLSEPWKSTCFDIEEEDSQRQERVCVCAVSRVSPSEIPQVSRIYPETLTTYTCVSQEDIGPGNKKLQVHQEPFHVFKFRLSQ